VNDLLAGLPPERRELVRRRLLEKQAGSAAVPRRETPGPYPLPYSAQLMWLLNQLVAEPSVYNVNICLRLKGELNRDALQRALNTLVERHEALRTNILVSDGVPLQIVRAPREVELRVLEAAADEAEVGRVCLAEVRRPLDLENDPLFQATLLPAGPGDHVLILLTHHMVFDGWSRRTVHQELGILYSAYCQGQENPLAPLPLQFADYAVWQRGEAQTLVIARQLEYWKRKLAGAPQTLDLPTDHARPAVQSFRGARVYGSFSEPTMEALRKLGSSEGATLFMTVLAALSVLLYRYTGQEDILVGAPMLGRPRPELEGIVGYFSNTTVIRSDLSGDPSFREFLRRIRAAVLEAMEQQEAPLEKLTMEMHPERDPSRSPLFQVMIGVGDDPPKPELAGLDVSPVRIDHDTSKLDLVLAVRATSTRNLAAFEYATDLFDPATAARMLDHLCLLLDGVAADPDRPISRLPLLTAAEKQQLLFGWNDTATPCPGDSVLGPIEAQASRTPVAPAAEFDGRQLTYGELNARANQFAHFLRRRGVAAESRVLVCADRSLELAAALLGILKAGAACVPIDPASPRARFETIAADTGAALIVTQQSLVAHLEGLGLEPICLDTDWPAVSSEPESDCGVRIAAEGLAFVLYTSGSTGVPKGVLLTHGGLANHQAFTSRTFGLQLGDRVLQSAPITSDVLLEELFPAWACGATVVFRPTDMPLGGREFGRWLVRQRITVVDLQTAFWHEWARSLASFEDPLPPELRLVIVGGEKAQMQALEDWRKKAGPTLRWTNTYGPTECSIIATAYEPLSAPEDPRVSIPIGRPIANTRVYILGGDLEPVPVGVAGEMFIAGAGLARGYLNRPELEAERFLADPFVPGARMYKTGDLGRFLADGNIEFLGRADRQVKVRGYRVEPGEIEAALAQHPSVAAAAVVEREQAGQVRLVAYVAGQDGQVPKSGELRAFLKDALPDYMIPSAFVVLDGGLPLTPHGKVDRNALPAADTDRTVEGEFLPPRDALEMELVGIWEKLLGVHPIGCRDSFFDVGGHSLLAVGLFTRIAEVFGVSLPVATILEAQTVEELAAILRARGWEHHWSSLVPVQPGGSRPPLFCVHAQSGQVLFYRDLARRLGDSQPLYGLQSAGWDGVLPRFSRVEDMAADYLKEVRELQAEGPYFLLGFCAGAYIAFEMARQLEACGQLVALLAVVDTDGNWKLTKSWRQQMAYHGARMTGLTLPERLRYLGGRLRFRSASVLRGAAIKVAPSLRSLVIQQLNVLASRAYEPGAYAGRLVYFQGNQRRSLAFWERIAGGGVDLRTLPGRGIELFREPGVEHLADALAACLRPDESASRPAAAPGRPTAGEASARASISSESTKPGA
jgi:amino acid adenylation domain-containing protein